MRWQHTFRDTNQYINTNRIEGGPGARGVEESWKELTEGMEPWTFLVSVRSGTRDEVLILSLRG